MAAIKNSDVLDKSVQKAFEDLHFAISASVKSLSQMVEESKNLNATIGGAKNIKEITAAQEKYNSVLNASKQEQIQAIKLQKEEEVLKQSIIKTQKAERIEKDAVLKQIKKEQIERAKNTSLYAQESKKLTDARNRAKDLALQYGQNSKEFKKAATEVQNLDSKLKKIDATLGQHNRSVGHYQKAWAGVRNILGAAGIGMGLTALLSGLKGAFKKVVEFEKGLSSLSSITGLAGKALDGLGKKALAMSRKYGIAGTDVLKAMELIGSAKPELLKNADSLAEVTKQAIILSQASGMELPEAAKSLTDILNQMGASSDEAARYINVLAAGAKAGAKPINWLSTAFEKSGTTANMMGISIEQMTGALESVAPFYTEASMAGNSFDKVLLKLKEKQIGYKNGVFDLNRAIDELKIKYQNGQSAASIFGVEHAKMGELLVKNKDTFNKLTTEVTGTSAALEMATINTNNYSGWVAKLGTAWDGLLVSFGKTEGATNLVRNLTGWVDKLRFAMLSIDEQKMERASNFAATFDESKFKTNAEKIAYLRKEYERLGDAEDILRENAASRVTGWNKTKDAIAQMTPFLRSFIDTNLDVSRSEQESADITALAMKQIREKIITLLNEEKIITNNTESNQENNETKKESIKLLESEIAKRKELEDFLSKDDEMSDKDNASRIIKGINIEDTSEADKKINDFLEKNIDNLYAKKLEDFEKEKALEEERAEFKKKLQDDVKENGINAVNTLFSASIDKKAQEIEAIDALLQQQLSNETLTQDQRDALEAKAEVKKRKIRDEQNKIARRQAIFDRGLSLMSIFNSTREAFMKAYALFPYSGGMPWSGLAIASGALQTAAVLGQPIPRYEKGTDNSKHGIAEVAEKGAELIVDKKYGAWIANERQHTFLSGGSKVYTADETSNILSAMNANDIMSANNIAVQMPLVNKLLSANKRDTDSIVKAISKQKVTIYNSQNISSEVVRKQDNMVSWLKSN